MELWSRTDWYLQFTFNLLILALATLIPLALASVSGGKFVEAGRYFIKTLRTAFDETDDLAVGVIAQKTGRTREEVRDFLVGNLDLVASIFPPPQETIPTVEIKEIAPPVSGLTG